MLKAPLPEAQHALAESSVELDALTRLVSDLVELARGEERKLRLEDLQLDDLVAATVERAQARAPQVTFVTALSPTQVRADPVLLERAVSNLLDNAVKYSPDGAPIEVSVRGGEVIVADHGPGIADEDLPRVFDRFYRAATARSKPGAGLGLAIVREAAEAHGGRATAESSPVGGSIPARAADRLGRVRRRTPTAGGGSGTRPSGRFSTSPRSGSATHGRSRLCPPRRRHRGAT